MNDKVEKWIRLEIRALKAYHVPEAKDYIKLDAMENPYHWPDDLIKEWQQRLAAVEINRYPDPEAQGLRQVLRDKMGIDPGLEIIFGNGSDELIQLILMVVGGQDRVILAPSPTFVMYDVISRCLGLSYQSVALQPDFSLDEAAMLAAIAKYQPAVVFLAYPNNPTGNLFEPQAVENIIRATPGLVVIDEAYHAFAAASFLPKLGAYDNVLLLRTLSKMGLAGLRLGYLVGSPAWLEQINKARLPYNIGVLTQVSTELALQHDEIFHAQTGQICQDRESLFAGMQTIAGIEVFPSRTNFLLFRVAAGRAADLFEHLKQAGILIKLMHGSAPALADCLRVTVGSAEQNQAFLDALQAWRG